MRLVYGVFCVLCGVGCSDPEPGVTKDIVTGSYRGDLRQRDLLPAVKIKEPGTALRVVLYEEDAVLWAKATFYGKIVKGVIALEGTRSDKIEGVTVDGDWLECIYEVSGVPLEVTGLFANDRRELDLEIEKVGHVLMEIEEEEDVEEVEEAA